MIKMKSENEDKLAKLEHIVKIAHYCIGEDMARFMLTPKIHRLYELMNDCNEVLKLIKNGKVKIIEEDENNERN